MSDPNDQQIDAQGAPSATDTGHQQGIVDDLPSWKKAIEGISDPTLKEALSKKIEGYDRRFTEKMTAISKREQEIAKVAEDLKTVATTPARGNISTAKAEGQKVLDVLMESSQDPSAREGIRQLRDAIREETDIEKLRATIDDLAKKFQSMAQTSQSVRRTELSKELTKLEDLYGSELLGRYKDQLETNVLKYPEYSARRWLHTLADPDELEQALRIHLKKQSSQPNGQETQPKPAKPAAVSTVAAPASEQYKGKGPRQARVGFDKAIGDSVKAALGKLAIGR